MTQTEQQKNAKQFANEWCGKGDEKQETQRYWMQLLGEVLDVKNPASYIEFEKRVKLSHTSFIDAYIPETKVLIEQKGIKIDLNKAYEQSDGTVLTPYQQAKRYADEMPYNIRPRWIVVSNFAEIHIHDMNKPNEKPEIIYLKYLEKDYYRLEFLVDRKNENIRREEEISLAAGKLVGKLYDALIKEYINPTSESYRSLNILCVRLVFCFYAEDAGLFETRTSFEDYIKSFAVENVRDGIIKLFKALDTKIENRDKYDLKLKPFPYVNGGLFHDENIEIPNFTEEIVDVLVNDCAPFDWHEISPTIFGAVFESTLNPETRRKGGMHYTSIENIHKVIDPLFLDDLNAEFDEIMGTSSLSGRQSKNEKIAVSSTAMTGKQRTAALYAFQEKLGHLTFLDPACGSGNFLTETYISLRRLENKVISALNKGEKVLGFDEFIKVKISQFFGIEINDFAVTVAKTALWIAESQMINETEKIISQQIDFLPLTTNAFIVEGNALRMDWATLTNLDGTKAEQPMLFEFSDDRQQTQDVSNSNVSRLKPNVYNYIMGNPPFVGYGLQDEEKKNEMLSIFTDENGKTYKSAGKIDYVAGWYFKAAELIQNSDTKCAFVSTNSITQGEQVALIWKPIFEKFHIKFDFAYRTFKWDSESNQKAHVHCVIIGFSCVRHPELVSGSMSEIPKQVRNDGNLQVQHDGSSQTRNDGKFIITENGRKITAQNINGYLLDAPDVFIESRSEPVCDVPKMTTGNRPADGGHLIIEEDEYEDFIKKEPEAKKFIKRLLGSEEFINNKKRWCLWLVDASPAQIKKMKEVYKRVQLCKQDRESSTDAGRRKLAQTPHLFRETNNPAQFLIVPKVSSEKRRYVPIGFFGGDTISTDLNFIIPNATLFHFGVLTSSVHMAWMRAVCGRLKSDYRYSKDIVYNNFPFIVPKKESHADSELLRNSNKTETSLDVSNPYGNFLHCIGQQAQKIEQTAQAILDARAKYPDSSLADLYDETLMPADLRKAHEANDRAVMQAYGFDAKMSESEIVAELFKMYERLSGQARQ